MWCNLRRKTRAHSFTFWLTFLTTSPLFTSELVHSLGLGVGAADRRGAKRQARVGCGPARQVSQGPHELNRVGNGRSGYMTMQNS